MRRPSLFQYMLLVPFLVLSGCTSGSRGSHGAVRTEPVRILRSATGDDPACSELGTWLIKSGQQLDQIASQELAGLQVDFTRESLIVVALGGQPASGYSVQITGTSKAGEDLFVQGVTTRPAHGAETLEIQTFPYAAAVIGRTSARRVLPEIVMGPPRR